MANVQLIDFTGKGRSDQSWHAAHLLMFTKATRLEMDSGLFEEIQNWPLPKKMEELSYMANTIPSSWEFADVTFLVTGVSRATANQMVRTRSASYAQQSLRVVDASDIGVVNPFPCGPEESEHANELHEGFAACAEDARLAYRHLIEEGAAPQDARGILPLNTESSIVCKYNLRNFVELMKARSSLRVQGEYVDIADQMKSLVLQVWPWVEPFFVHPQQKAIDILERVASELGITPGKGHGWEIAKAIDLIRKG